ARRPFRESFGERRLLDCAPHRGRRGGKISVAVSLAGSLVGGLFVQRDAVVRLAAPGHRVYYAGSWPGSRVSCHSAGRAPTPYGESADLFFRILLRCAFAGFQP